MFLLLILRNCLTFKKCQKASFFLGKRLIQSTLKTILLPIKLFLFRECATKKVCFLLFFFCMLFHLKTYIKLNSISIPTFLLLSVSFLKRKWLKNILYTRLFKFTELHYSIQIVKYSIKFQIII